MEKFNKETTEKINRSAQVQEGIFDSNLQKQLKEEMEEIAKLKEELGIGEDGAVPPRIFDEHMDDFSKKHFSGEKQNWENAVNDYEKRTYNVSLIREKIKNLGGELDTKDEKPDTIFKIQRGSLN